jgi:hypothetical protein
MSDTRRDVPLLPELAGEASPGIVGIRTLDGRIGNPGHAIFPIVKVVNKRVHLIGTGFFITDNGLFATAKHVLMDAFDEDGREKYGIGLFHFIEDNVYISRPILRFSAHPIADVAVGVAAPMQNNKTEQPLNNPYMFLDFKEVSVGSNVVTYAYPRFSCTQEGTSQKVEFNATYYDGYIREYFPNGRDKVVLPGPCYQTSIHIHGGASGGPVFGPNGLVFGINSTGIDGTDISYVSRTSDILHLRVDDVLVNDVSRSVLVYDFIRAQQPVPNTPVR